MSEENNSKPELQGFSGFGEKCFAGLKGEIDKTRRNEYSGWVMGYKMGRLQQSIVVSLLDFDEELPPLELAIQSFGDYLKLLLEEHLQHDRQEREGKGEKLPEEVEDEDFKQRTYLQLTAFLRGIFTFGKMPDRERVKLVFEGDLTSHSSYELNSDYQMPAEGYHFAEDYFPDMENKITEATQQNQTDLITYDAKILEEYIVEALLSFEGELPAPDVILYDFDSYLLDLLDLYLSENKENPTEGDYEGATQVRFELTAFLRGVLTAGKVPLRDKIEALFIQSTSNPQS